MSLNKTTTANDIVTQLVVINPNVDQTQAKAMWAAIIDALYTRLKADIVVQSIVAANIPVSTTGSAVAQTGNTTTTGTASTVGGSVT